MTTVPPDPFDELAAMAAHIDRSPLEPGDDPRADALLERVVASPRVVSLAPAVRRRRRIAVAAAAVVAVGGGTVAAVWGREPADAVAISCYSEASATPAQIFGTVMSGGDPVESCRTAWADGTFGRTATPPLEACVDARGALVVVPGEPGACDVLGWSPASAVSARQRMAASVADRVAADLMATCRSEADDAVDAVERVLDELGADDWTIAVRQPSEPSDGLCFAPSFDGTAETVELIAIAIPGN